MIPVVVGALRTFPSVWKKTSGIENQQKNRGYGIVNVNWNTAKVPGKLRLVANWTSVKDHRLRLVEKTQMSKRMTMMMLKMWKRNFLEKMMRTKNTQQKTWIDSIIWKMNYKGLSSKENASELTKKKTQESCEFDDTRPFSFKISTSIHDILAQNLHKCLRETRIPEWINKR